MGIQAWRELPRVYDRELWGAPQPLSRRFVLTLADTTLLGAATSVTEGLSVAGILIGTTGHPEFTNFLARKVRVEEGFEGNPYETLVTVEYGLVREDERSEPTDRPAQWSCESSTIEVPALYYYDGSGNSTKRPLMNSANDYFQGLTASEPIVRLQYVKNFAASALWSGGFPWSQVNAVGSINAGDWGSNIKHTARVETAAVTYNEEEFKSQIHKYWALTANIAIRATSWNLQLPDVGFNYLAGGQKRRAMVRDEQNGEWIPSPNPVGLDGSGNQTNGAPEVLNRRVCPEANFTSLFGAPPS